MGCDIQSYGERRNKGGGWEWVRVTPPFDWRNYGMYAFFAGVRNYSGVTPISEPRGVPDDVSLTVDSCYFEDTESHSASWLSLEELEAFDYSAKMEDRRYTDQFGNGGATCEPGKGVVQTWREFLGESFFEEIERLKRAGVERIVFWFQG